MNLNLAPLGRSSSQNPPALITDWSFRAEIVTTFGVGALLFWVFGLKDIAQITWIVGGLLLYHRAMIDSVWRRDIGPLEAGIQGFSKKEEGVASFINLHTSAAESARLQSAIDNYFRIVEQDFALHKDRALSEFNSALEQMVHQKTSPTMLTAEYYAWLLPRIRSARPGDEIWAVSRFMECEWDDSPEETSFLEENLAAASRGVRVTRLFITTRDVWKKSVADGPIRSQIQQDGLTAYFGDESRIRQNDARILRLVGAGLIGFDNKVVLRDEHSDDGSARGYVLLKSGEVQELHNIFEQLRLMCSGVSAADLPAPPT